MDSSSSRLDAASFLHIWRLFDPQDRGYIERKNLDDLFGHVMKKLGKTRDKLLEEKLQRLRASSTGGRLHIHQLTSVLLPEEESFLLLFRRETPLDNSVEFMRIWRNYDADSSGFISAVELKSFLQDLFQQHKKSITPEKLDQYTDAMMKMFDKNQDGHLDLNDLARILSLKENFLLKFEMDACSQKDRKRDFEKIFAHYDVSKTGELEGPEVDGFVKDMMELVKPSLSGADLDRFKRALLSHCDVNGDGKIQKNELALCLGLKLTP
ncbi:secretagogin-like [Hoplias malabaricus]|uniref:secretagogin-like n=1 Tax=Hoplias malabaricus TaxID=27720 RepID=UPI0034618B2E